MMTNPHALALTAAAERILPLTKLHPQDQRAAAVNLIGDLYKVADDIDAGAPAPTADGALLATLGAAVALAQIELERAYQATKSHPERQRLAPLVAMLRDAMTAYRDSPVTPKAPKKAA